MKLLKITDKLTMVDENHLGGFIIENDPATFTPTLWEFLCKTYDVKKVVDVGCGMGFATKEFLKYADTVIGIEGSDYAKANSSVSDHIIQFDFSKQKYIVSEQYDLAWCCEFIEHVDEKYIENYFDIFKNSKYVAITYADKDQEGHHHVNCQPAEYWINYFEKNNFTFLNDDLKTLKTVAYKDAILYNTLYKDNHFYNRGLFFKNNNIN